MLKNFVNIFTSKEFRVANIAYIIFFLIIAIILIFDGKWEGALFVLLLGLLLLPFISTAGAFYVNIYQSKNKQLNRKRLRIQRLLLYLPIIVIFLSGLFGDIFGDEDFKDFLFWGGFWFFIGFESAAFLSALFFVTYNDEGKSTSSGNQQQESPQNSPQTTDNQTK